MVESQKVEAIAAKRHGAREESSLSSEEQGENDIGDDMDTDKVNDK